MKITNKIDCFFKTINWSIALLALSAFLASLYHLFHSNSKSGPGTIFTFSAAMILFVVFLFITPRLNGKFTAKIYPLFVFGLLLRISCVLYSQNEQVSDFQINHELALSLYNRDGFSYTGTNGIEGDVKLFLNNYNAKPPVPTAFRFPVYPLILSFVYHITGPVPIAGLMLNAILGALTGIFLLLLIKDVNRDLAFMAAILWEIYPASVLATNLLCAEILFTFLVTGTALALKTGFNKSAKLDFLFHFIAGFLLSSAVLTRPATQLLIAAPFAILLQKKPMARKAVLLLILIAGAAIPLSIWGMRNYQLFGHFEIQTTEIGIGWFTLTRELVVKSNPRLDALTDEYFSTSDEFRKARLGKEIGQKRFLEAAKSAGIFKRFFQNHLKGWRDDTDSLSWSLLNAKKSATVELFFTFLARICYLFILLSAGIGALRADPKNNCGLLFLILYTLGSSILMVLFEGQPRYHFQLMPVLCLLSPFAWGAFQRGSTFNNPPSRYP